MRSTRLRENCSVARQSLVAEDPPAQLQGLVDGRERRQDLLK